MVVIALAVMGVLAIAILATSGDEREASLAVQEGTRSFYAADAGLNHVLAQWPDSNYDTRVVAAGSSYTFAWRTLPENGATYRAVLQRLSAGGPISLTVDGRSAAARRGLRTVQVALTISSSSAYGILTRGNLTWGGSVVDSWDSRVGPYAASNCVTLGVTCNGDLGSQGTLSVTGGTVKGDALAAVVSGCARVTGTCPGPAPTQVISSVSCPAGFSPAVDVPVPPATSYSAVTGNLTLNAGSSLTLNSAKSPYRLHNATVRSDIIVPVGSGHVDVYISGTLAMSSGGIVNMTGDPSKLTIWGCGADVTGWSVHAGSSAYFAIYAPDHPVDLKAGSELYGSIVAASLTSSASATVHFDAALGSAPVLVLMPGSWTEVAH
jgi:hypothetical protein